MRAYVPISSYLQAIAFFALDILRTMHLTPFMQICSLLPPSRFNHLLSSSILTSKQGPLLGTLKWRDTTIHQVLGALVVEADEHTWLRAFDRYS